MPTQRCRSSGDMCSQRHWRSTSSPTSSAMRRNWLNSRFATSGAMPCWRFDMWPPGSSRGHHRDCSSPVVDLVHTWRRILARWEDGMARFVIAPHMRLHEWVAEEKGYFADAGLDYEFVDELRSPDGRRHDLGDRVGAYQTIEKGRSSD